MIRPEVAAVVTVHPGVALDHLAQAISSLETQTRRPDEVVFVCDGRLPRAHLELIRGVALSSVTRVELEQNRGAGVSNQVGLMAATSHWVAKVDADDVNLPHRLETQLATVRSQQVDVLGAAMLEFDEDPDRPTGLRLNPLDHASIARRMRWNNPINHPTAFYRRSSALAVGGYSSMRYMQDYDLFARMLANGARMANLPEPLVAFRRAGVIARRAAGTMDRVEVDLQQRLREVALTSRGRHAVNLVTRSGARRLPSSSLDRVHRRMFSRSTVDGR